MFRSIRHGLFAALAGFTVALCIAYTGLAVVISYVTEDMLVDRLLQREAAAITAHFRAHGELRPAGLDLIRTYRNIDALPPAVRERATAGAKRAEIFTDTGQHYHLRTIDIAAGATPLRLYLVADVAPLLVVSRLVQDVGGILVGTALALTGLALLLAYFLSRRLVSPLQRLAREVRDLQSTFSASTRRDEIGYLARRLGTSIGELQAALRREHAFTRDVSHELRTPLTVMANTLALARGGALATRDVAQLQAGLDEIRGTIDVLFALARAEQIQDEDFDLRACIEQGLLRLLAGSGWDSKLLTLDMPDRVPVTGNRHLATLLIDNCLANALFHGGPATRLQVAYADGRLSIANTVDAGRAGGVQGFRHGQDLLGRIATAMRWELGFYPGGTVYRVEIVPPPLDRPAQVPR